MILYAVEKHDSGRWPSWASFQQSHPASEAVDVSISPEGTHPWEIGIPCITHIPLGSCLHATVSFAHGTTLLTLASMGTKQACMRRGAEEQHRHQQGLHGEAEGGAI